MKRVVALLLATVFGSSLFAAFQYDVIPVGSNTYGGLDGNYFKVTILSGTGNIYIVDKISDKYKMANNTELLKDMMVDYGYIHPSTGTYIQGSGLDKDTILTYEKKMAGANTDLVYQTAYKVGTFNEGDTFGVWIKNKGGEYSTSIYSADSKHSKYVAGEDAIGTTLAQLSYNNGNPSNIFFGFHGVGIDTPSTFGQPLPGMFATFLLGGSVLGGAAGMKRRKKRI
ncbi:MAG: hypothetical protein GX927_13150 [Lentisphaerae bacterium]|jgi:hypothetical protein|nr:hypothetical protein [Lentisphaerota bacterium]